jgi:uncharacterized protein with NRDE domain
MCTILLAIHKHAGYPLVLLGNRDEAHGRPSLPAHYWQDAPHILAGKDLRSGGTWLGVSRRGRWAVVSNIRSYKGAAGEQSRGRLVSSYLRDEVSPGAYLDRIQAQRLDYGPFNLLIGERTDAWFCSSRGEIKSLGPGIHGLSNADLDTPWPKVQRGKSALAEQLRSADTSLSPAGLLSVLSDTTVPPDDELPDTGIGPERERLLAPIFVRGADYGTRCSTLLLFNHVGSVSFVEQNYTQSTVSELRRFEFELG